MSAGRSGAGQGDGGARVSVLLAVHNGMPYLDGALASIAGQDFEDWECITVDDASTDGSGEVLRRWAARDPRFTMIRATSNHGLAASLNRALELARGDYVARMDADDECLTDRFALQVAYLDGHPEVTVLGGAALYMDPSGRPLGAVVMPEGHGAIVAALPRRNPLIHPTVMMRRQALVSAGGYDPGQRFAQDLELWARGAALGWRFHNLPEPVLRFRSQPETHSSHLWSVFRLRLRNGLRYGYPLRAAFWALVGLAHVGVSRLGHRFRALGRSRRPSGGGCRGCPR